MELGDIKDQFTSVAKKVTSTVDDTVVSPLENVKTTVTRSVVGPSLGLMEHLEETFKKNYMIREFHKQLLALGRNLKKETFSQTDWKKILKAFKGAELYMKEIEKYTALEKALKGYVADFKKLIKDGKIASDCKDGCFITTGSDKLAKKNKQILITAYEEFEIQVKSIYKSLNDSIESLFVKAGTSSYRHDKNVDKTKNTLKGLYTTGLDKEFELISQWKELSRYVHGLQTHTTKIEKLREKESHSFGPSKTSYQESIKKEEKKIISVLKSSIANQLQKIEALEKELATNEQAISEAIESYVGHASEYKSYLKTWIATNEAATDALVSNMKKERTSIAKQKSMSQKRLEQSFTAFQKTAVSPFENVTGLRDVIDTFHRNDALYDEVEYVYESTYLQQVISVKADLKGYTDLLDFLKKSLYSDIDIHREHQIHQQLSKRVQGRHLTLVKSVWTRLLDLKQSNPKLYEELVKTLEKKNDVYTKRKSDTATSIEKKKATLKLIKDSLWNTVQFELVLAKMKQYVNASFNSQLYTIYADYLKTHRKLEQTRYKNIADASTKADNEVKKSKVELSDKEKSTETIKKTAALRKELKILHQKEHNQELFASALHNFADETKHHLSELKDMAKGYEAEVKKTSKQVSSLAKDIQSQLKKIKKLPLAKEMILPDLVKHDALKII